MPLAAGTRLGPYEVLAPLGAGGMGEVYQGRDTRLDRTVALKVLPGHIANDPELRQRLDREARAISSLNHPHICALYDIGRQDGVDFLVMEYVEGETLAARLAKGPLPLADALRTGIEIADALDKAHRAGIVHRDLKPANIMITKAGSKLLDFGIARLEALGATQGLTLGAALTGEGRVIGTPQYMAPEQIEGKLADARADLFAFGNGLVRDAHRSQGVPGPNRGNVHRGDSRSGSASAVDARTERARKPRLDDRPMPRQRPRRALAVRARPARGTEAHCRRDARRRDFSTHLSGAPEAESPPLGCGRRRPGRSCSNRGSAFR